MARRGKSVFRRSRKRRVPREKGSDDSDEDYVLVGDEENETSDGEELDETVDSEDMCSSSEEFEEERKLIGLKPQRAVRGGGKQRIKRSSIKRRNSEDDEDFIPDGMIPVNGRQRGAVRSNPVKRFSNSIKRSSKRTRASVDSDDGSEDSDDDDDDEEDFAPDGIDFSEDDEDYLVSRSDVSNCGRQKATVRSNATKGFKRSIKSSRKRKRPLAKFDDESEDCDDDDEEFTPDGVDFASDDEDLLVRGRNNTSKRVVPKRVIHKGQRRKSESKAAKKPLRKKRRRTKRNSALRRVVRSDDDFLAEDRVVKEKTKKKKPRRTKKRKTTMSYLDSEWTQCSDLEYTISEEEREVLREASIFCGNLTRSLRSSSLSKQLQADGTNNHLQKRRMGGKGKEKVEDLKIDVGKQVCGICLSEEGKGTVRGTLNCCNHYFCYGCILEWSKVETRCPLCKERFVTISKPAKSLLGFDLRNVVLQVPKRDQVYRPSEEEVRGYIDPYENVICVECQLGGDDNLMLLCDICDSAAHSYCVGLGREVPEGNWYCECCRSSDLGSSNSLVQDPVFSQTANNNLAMAHSTGEITVENSDFVSQNSVSIQHHSDSPGTGVFPSPRHALGGDFQATSPAIGNGATTLSGRRRIRHRVHSLLSSTRMNGGTEMASRTNGTSQVNFGSEFGNCENELGKDSTSCPLQEVDASGASFGHLGTLNNEGPSTATLNGPSGALCVEHAEVDAAGVGQIHRSSSTDANVSHSINGDLASFHAVEVADEQKGAKQQLQPIVRHHLKKLSRCTQIDREIFKDIARRSTHTILAACGLDHSRSIAIPVQPPSRCSHLERQSEPTNQMEKCCSSCFNSFISEVVRRIMDMRCQSVGFSR